MTPEVGTIKAINYVTDMFRSQMPHGSSEHNLILAIIGNALFDLTQRGVDMREANDYLNDSKMFNIHINELELDKGFVLKQISTFRDNFVDNSITMG